MVSSPPALDDIVTPDVSPPPDPAQHQPSPTRDDGTPLNYTLVNLKDWCKNHFEVINQLRVNTDNSHHRYDVILLINGVPCVQIELKTSGVNPAGPWSRSLTTRTTRQRLHQDAAVLHAALHRQQPRPHLLLRQQQRPALSASMPMSVSCPSTSSPTRQQEDHPARCLCRSLPAKCTWQKNHQPLHGAGGQRAKLMMMRPYQVYAVQSTSSSASTRTAATATSGTPPAAARRSPPSRPPRCSRTTRHRQMPVRGGPQRPGPPDPRGIQPFQEGCVEENTNTGALVRRLLSTTTRQGHRHHHPEAGPGAG